MRFSGICSLETNRISDISLETTFSDQVRAHQGAVRTFLRRLTRDAAEADDLAQITFIKAYERNKGLNGIGSPRSWFLKIAYRTFVDEYRKSKRQSRLAEKVISCDDGSPTTGLSIDIEKAMAQLPPDCRAVVFLCLGQGLTHSEASEITQMPLGTVKSHVKRGKEKLRTFLAAYETVV